MKLSQTKIMRQPDTFEIVQVKLQRKVVGRRGSERTSFVG